MNPRNLFRVTLVIAMLAAVASPRPPAVAEEIDAPDDFDQKIKDARAARDKADAAAAQARDDSTRAKALADQAARDAKTTRDEADQKSRDLGKAKNAQDKKTRQAVADEAKRCHDKLEAQVTTLRNAAGAAQSKYDQKAAQARAARQRLDDLLAAAGLPMSGFPVAELKAYDDAMQKFMRERGIKAGTLAVMKDGRLVLSRSYGYANASKTQTLGPDVPLRIASVGKPITAAAILRLIREGKLKPYSKAFVLLGVQPRGPKADSRLLDITIQHLLDHQGGWDSEKAFDPMFESHKIAAALKKRGPADASDIIRYMAGQPLQFAPGSKTTYSNFGYCLLGRVIEKVTGKSYLDYVSDDLLAPLKIKSVELGRSRPGDRNPREPNYSDPDKAVSVVATKGTAKVAMPDGGFCLEAMDANGGLIASAADLVRFAQAYTVHGQPRSSDSKQAGREVAFGSLPGTHSMLLWRDDGVNIAALFNQRTDPSGLSYDAIKDVLNKVTDNVKTWPTQN